MNELPLLLSNAQNLLNCGNKKKMSQKKGVKYEEMDELRRGPWTLEEDSLLIHYIAHHGEGRWNLLAKCSGLKRTGKSCRLRWLNYLKPDVKRGNLSLEEQIMILQLHSKWGNRWSRIAQYLPGRTDNEIKNYWRTRVQKHARQLNIDSNSAIFRDTIQFHWMPKLIKKIASNNGSMSIQSTTNSSYTTQASLVSQPQNLNYSTPQEYYFGPSNTNCYSTTSTSYNVDMLGVENSSSSIECIEEGSNWVDGLWSMDELWVRKPNDCNMTVM